ncbi:MAG TPA: hypothetical protein VF690_00110 [Hymenobacter sp.]
MNTASPSTADTNTTVANPRNQRPHRPVRGTAFGREHGPQPHQQRQRAEYNVNGNVEVVQS